MLAIALSRQVVRESDERITLFTRDQGKIKVLIRGTKKIVSKNAPFLEPFFFIDAELVPGKEGLVLTRAVPIVQFSSLYNNLKKCLCLIGIIETISPYLPENENNTEIFDLLLDFLETLNEKNENLDWFADYYIYQIFGHLGFLPRLEECLCGNKEAKYFSIEQGGLVCSKCLMPGALNFEENLMKYFLSLKNKSVQSQNFEAHKLLLSFWRYHLDPNIRDWLLPSEKK